MRGDTSPGVAERYSEGKDSDSSSSDGDYATPRGGESTSMSYEDIHMKEKKGGSTDATPGDSDEATLLLRRHSTYRAALKSPDGAVEEAKAKAFQLKELDLEIDGIMEEVPSTPPPKNDEQFVSPKSLSMSPNVKAVDPPPEERKPPYASESRRKQLLEYTNNLWQILDDICEHSTLTQDELAGTSDRIKKLRAMNDELGALESKMENLQTVYAYESKYYLEMLRRLERVVTVPVEESESIGQTAIDRSFSRSVCKILYDDKKAKGTFQLVSARLGEDKD